MDPDLHKSLDLGWFKKHILIGIVQYVIIYTLLVLNPKFVMIFIPLLWVL